MSRDRSGEWMATALVLLMIVWGSTDALGVTLHVYRIGRKPPSEEVADGVEYHYLDWDDLTPEIGGTAQNLDMSAERVQPKRFAPEENMATALMDLGGQLSLRGLGWYWTLSEDSKKVVDGDPSTAYEWGELSSMKAYQYGASVGLLLDLGGRFIVNKLRLYPREKFPGRFAEQLDVYVNDGDPRNVLSTSFSYGGNLIYTLAAQVRENRDPVIEMEIPDQTVRYIRVDIQRNTIKALEIAELEVFGKGYVERASYTTDMLDMGELTSWGELRWSGWMDSGAKVWIQTRSGMDETPNVYWRYTGRGGEKTTISEKTGRGLTAGEYAVLTSEQKAGMTYDVGNWSFWSAPYTFSDSLGVSVVSPGPRRYFQMRVDFVNTPTAGGGLGYLEFRGSSPPAAERVVAEIWPVEVRTGERSRFTYAVKPTIRVGDTGFDRLEIVTPLRIHSVDSVRIGGEDVSFRVEGIWNDRFVVGFPELDSKDSGTLLEVVFSGAVVRYGTLFVGKVYDSGEEHQVHQLVEGGDAAYEYGGDGLFVRTGLGEEVLRLAGGGSLMFSPNGDGVHDEVEIGYDVLKLTDAAQVSVRICDLAGREVREVYRGEDASGRYVRVWDGRDGEGVLVSPGVYMYSVTVSTDREKQGEAGVVSVVY